MDIRDFTLPLHKTSCTRTIKSKLSCRSLALSLHHKTDIGMKRSCHILVSIALSALIILLGVGVSFVDCCHTQHALRAAIACTDSGSHSPDNGSTGADGKDARADNGKTSSGDEDHGNCCGDCPSDDGSGCGCAPQTSCLTVAVAKLAPFSDAVRTPVCFTCPMAMLPRSFVSCPPAPLAETVSAAELSGCNGNNGSPPRARLLFLGILRL